MQPNPIEYRTRVGDHELIIETGHLAGQAGGALTLRLGNTVVLAAATMSDDPRQGMNFLPLTIDYEERMYAGGRIPGSFFRREGRPTEHAILTNRLTDRSLRPLFDKNLRNEIQVVLYSISHDDENPIDILAVNAASLALMISNIPWAGPIAAVRIGRLNGEFVVNPTFSQQNESDLNLVLSGTRDAILMVESGANELSESTMVAALEFGQNAIQPIIELQEKMAAEIGKPRRTYTPTKSNEELRKNVSLACLL